MKSRSRIILPKNSNLNSLSYSHCASTNDSKDNKEFLKKQNSILKKDNVNKMKEIMGHNLHKYTTSQEEYFLNYFQTVISSLSQKDSSFNLNKKLSKICLKDCKFDIDNQNMQEKYKSNQIQKELVELTEYYKYYTNNPILYHKEYFKSLYQYYERKKYVQYKRLKAILNLQEQSNQNQSVSSKNQNISQNSSQIINQDTFYVGPFLNLSKVSSKKRHTNQIEETSVCESEAFQNLNFQMNYLMSKGNSKMVPISKENNFNSFQYLLSMKKNKPPKNVIDIQELDKLYDFTKKQSDLKMQKNTRKKSQQIHNSPSKRLSKSSKKILNHKQEMQNVNKLQSQIQQFKEQNQLLFIQNRMKNKKQNKNQKKIKKNRRLNSCQTFLNNNTLTIPNNSSKFATTAVSAKKKNKNIRSLQKIQTLKSQIERQKISDFRIFLEKQHKFKQRFKRLSNLASKKNSPDMKKSLNKKACPISGSHNSLDKNFQNKYKDAKTYINQFQGYRTTSNFGEKNLNLNETDYKNKKQKLKSLKTSKQIVVDTGIQGLKKKINEQKKILLELKDLKDSKVVTKKNQKKEGNEEEKKREKIKLHGIKQINILSHQKGKK